MPSESRLLSEQFFQFYLDCVGWLANRYRLNPKPDEAVLLARHEAWREDIYQWISVGRRTRPEIWEHALATLAVALASCECITYAPRGPVARAETLHQDLLVEFPAIYTALQYARNEYMNAYLHGPTVRVPEEFARLEHPDLRGVMRLVRNDPREAANFAALLRLP